MVSNSVSGSLEAFKKAVKDSATTKAIPTGFNILDETLDGGFYEGFYVIGAITGIGKTTFCQQIADQAALRGVDVIEFSLEMSKYTLISKSLSRLTWIEDKSKDNKGFHYARTSRQILTGAIISDREKRLYENALQRYNKDYSNNLYIYDGNIGIELIREKVSEHVSLTGKRPLVIVDYLQILTPHEQNGSDKQFIDQSVLELKRISMEHGIPVIAVSSFNRNNYLTPVNITSFKESGAIEYSSDVLLGLQFKGMDSLSQDGPKSNSNSNTKKVEDWQRADCRELELKILKNRNGASGDSIFYSYYPKFNYFSETSKSVATGRAKT